jgi:DNA-binding response OmpR family regulator
MASARADRMDRVIGLKVGADDFTGKPFSEKKPLALRSFMV